MSVAATRLAKRLKRLGRTAHKAADVTERLREAAPKPAIAKGKSILERGEQK